MPPLHGIEDIKKYTRKSWRKLMELRHRHHFPMEKINGRWESHTDLIDEWQKKRFVGLHGRD